LLFQKAPPYSFLRSAKGICNSVFTTPFSLHNREDLALFNEKSVETKSIDKIVNFLGTNVDKGTKNIYYVGGTLSRFLVDHDNFKDKNIDLMQFGEAMQRIVFLTLPFASARNGILLIDEIENSIHFGLMKRFAELILELSQEFNTQVFITSHSKECIDAFLSVKTELKNITAYQMIEEDEQIKCKYMSGQRLAKLIKLIDADLRGDK
jgi:AAA15 family ATPase/GTPase